MSSVICFTNRKLCSGDFLARIGMLAAARPAAIVLREKDLSEQEYFELSKQVARICADKGVKFIAHKFVSVALKLGCSSIHLPLYDLKGLSVIEKAGFDTIGLSCHSVEEAKYACDSGCSYIVAGHIFDTDCKKGLPCRGLDFLSAVCRSVSVPVYAIGGIKKSNVRLAREAGAAGVCIMSSAMSCSDPTLLLEALG